MPCNDAIVTWIRRALMDSKGTSWLKKEKNEVYAEPGSLVQLHTSTMKVKEELDEQVNQQFLQDPPRIVMPSLRIKQDLELKQDLDGIKHDATDIELRVTVFPKCSATVAVLCYVLQTNKK
ncbi:uncharacterized protein LOC124720379 isoform X5 [Schistocerca piceifrons]|uniref:uncharacterized protein LOC124720379 isoform X5 n=1 Tax=Schistocerca piceifrons TaxID=274613 RepID=UPI001F5F85C7|nr:uncharacterized protein LOC124720379 isoform X5 [Schistocerca piceifrons]XP_047101672.1 uncharacterized protein LOC124720379 isoform X5 [Schistocerca piceifrons]